MNTIYLLYGQSAKMLQLPQPISGCSDMFSLKLQDYTTTARTSSGCLRHGSNVFEHHHSVSCIIKLTLGQNLRTVLM